MSRALTLLSIILSTKSLYNQKISLSRRCISILNNVNYNYLEIIDTNNKYNKVRYYDSGSSLKPLVILIGTGQTIDSYIAHIKPFSLLYRLIVIELRCQGKTELLSQFSTIDQHLNDCHNIFNSLSLANINLVGFSFGGRVALAFASSYPNKISKLSITGVPLQRSGLGKSIIDSWKVSLMNNDIEGCAWSMIINGFSEKFIDRNFDKLDKYVDSIVNSNDPKKLFDLINTSHLQPLTMPSISVLAQNIKCSTQIIGCSEDRIANVKTCKQLADQITNSRFDIIESAHLAPFENPVHWRNLIINFNNN